MENRWGGGEWEVGIQVKSELIIGKKVVNIKNLDK